MEGRRAAAHRQADRCVYEWMPVSGGEPLTIVSMVAISLR
jgi:hypothetical protein